MTTDQENEVSKAAAAALEDENESELMLKVVAEREKLEAAQAKWDAGVPAGSSTPTTAPRTNQNGNPAEHNNTKISTEMHNKKDAVQHISEEEGTISVAPTSMRRTHAVSPALGPGAYTATPGEGLHRTQALPKHINLEASASANTHDTAMQHQNGEELEQPRLVVDPPIDHPSQRVPVALEVSERQCNVDLESAEYVDMDAVLKKQAARKQQKHIFVAFSLALVAIALIIGLVVGLKRNAGDTIVVSPTTAPEAPTPSTGTPAPTELLDEFVLTLPESTQASILNGFSAQYQALEWLEGHPNVTEYPDWRKTQLFALACFYFAMEGPNWKPGISERWMDYEKDECQSWYSGVFGFFNESQYWQYVTYGVDPCNDEGVFENLVLSFLELEGYQPFVPPEIALLTDLQILALQFDDINASFAEFLPLELYRMPNLQILNLHTNDFHGYLPSELGLLENLSSLSVATCELTGAIPSEIGLLTNLEEMYLQKNSLSSSLPTEMGTMSSLERFYIWRNALTGNVPSELGSLSNTVKTVELFSNYLTGAIPSQLGLMTTLTDLALDANMLTGTLSSHIGALSGLEGFFVHYNDLSGSLPSEIGSWVNVTHLGFQENNHNGPIPSEFGLLSGVDSIFLQDNQFSGNVPIELLQLPQLALLDLSKNTQLGGFIPLDKLTSALKHLNISRTSLSGTVPDRLCIADETCSVGFFWDPSPCSIGFDCSDLLCGCACACPSSGGAI